LLWAAGTTGGVGTGKTVVAMPRAKRLVAGVSGHERQDKPVETRIDGICLLAKS